MSETSTGNGVVGDELYKRYRPRRFQDLVGQNDAIRMLTEMGRKGAIPHTLLLTGPSGCGKTTIARILREKLKCGDKDFQELNAADDRGIDIIREIRQHSGLAPITGSCRIWLIDECFPAGTLVSTPNGNKAIEFMSVGDKVFNVAGVGRVKSVFRNRVDLRRVVRIYFDDGTSMVTTNRHEFLTLDGWIRANSLTGYCIFRPSCHILYSRRCRYGKMESDEGCVRFLQSGIHQGVGCYSGEQFLLLKKMCNQSERENKRKWSGCGKDLPRMRAGLFCGQEFGGADILQQIMCGKGTKQETGIQNEAVLTRGGTKDKRVKEEILQDSRGAGTCLDIFGTTEVNESFAKNGICGEDEGHQISEWDIAPMERKEGRQRPINQTTTEAMEGLGGVGSGVGVGVCCGYGRKEKSRDDASYPLQDRCGSWRVEDRHRSGRTMPQVERLFNDRCQEDALSRRLRVVRVEVYQPGCNDRAFEGIVTDRCRDRGYVEFFDLEVQDHPSYFANGIPVHNCHQLTPQAQESFLKLLEDTPKHVYFFLATTDPGKLKKTIITRCTEIKVSPLKLGDAKKLLNTIAEAEGKTVEPDVVEKIVELADGSARKLLVLLHQIIDLPSEEEKLTALQASDVKQAAVNIAKALMNPRTRWPEIATIIKNVEEEPETIRRIVLAYVGAVALNKPNPIREIQILEAFLEPYFNTGKAGLIQSCAVVLLQKGS